MTRQEAITDCGNQPGYIFKTVNGKAFLVVGNRNAIGLNGYIELSSLASNKASYAANELWKIGSNPGSGITEILRNIESGKDIDSSQAHKICDLYPNMDSRFLNTKVFVGTKSAEIQKKLFKLGYQWRSGDRFVQQEDEPFLYVSEGGLISFSGNNYKFFKEQLNKEVSILDILSYDV